MKYIILISNRRLKGGLRIILCAVSGKIRLANSLIANQLPPATEFLLATVAWGTGRLVPSFRENMERISSEDVRQEVQRFWAILSGNIAGKLEEMYSSTAIVFTGKAKRSESAKRMAVRRRGGGSDRGDLMQGSLSRSNCCGILRALLECWN